jgi:hypothetical protein
VACSEPSKEGTCLLAGVQAQWGLAIRPRVVIEQPPRPTIAGADRSRRSGGLTITRPHHHSAADFCGMLNHEPARSSRIPIPGGTALLLSKSRLDSPIERGQTPPRKRTSDERPTKVDFFRWLLLLFHS